MAAQSGVSSALTWPKTVGRCAHPSGETWRVPHTREAVAALVLRLLALDPALITLEALRRLRSPGNRPPGGSRLAPWPW